MLSIPVSAPVLEFLELFGCFFMCFFFNSFIQINKDLKKFIGLACNKSSEKSMLQTTNGKFFEF